MVEIILSNLIDNKEYFSKVWPYMSVEYFDGPAKTLVACIKKHVNEYNLAPTKNAIIISLESSKLSAPLVDGAKELLSTLSTTPEDSQWLLNETEKYIQGAAMYNATSKILEIQANADLPEGQRNHKLPDVGAIPDIMRDALAVSFDSNIGHDWLDDADERYRSYMEKKRKVPFKLSILNKITKGGAELGTLNIIMAGVNVGKSLGLCSLAADYLQTGKNVLYISMEMAEEVCAKRIDANLLDVSLDDIDDGKLSYPEFKQKMDKWRNTSTLGKLIVKQYPTGGANANTFRAYINELKLKKQFVPDVIIVDYLGICGSSRIKQFTENSYTLVKAIAEELRALAVETNTVMWSAAQTGRGAWEASDIGMQDVAESAGLPATADFMLAAIETEELAQIGQQLIKQIKSRYGDKNINNKFNLIVKKGNQRWMELDGSVIEASAVSSSNKEQSEKKAIAARNEKRNSRSDLDSLAEEIRFK
ncbi:helicase [Pseudomonas phage PspYZU05]|uniref:DnaB-like replicative helicase n=1 Tax=Pseudomonas phage PspYZU05 TaxID=1983556 RepID=A0A2U7NMZ7_9CAUD|nr:helicase [Pseudomonas phage PspYZU05]ASD52017.1 helicase [Pseudomonas phage PspYZU05]